MLEKKSGFHYIFLKKPTGCPADHVLAGREHSTGLLSAASVPAKLRMPDGRGGGPWGPEADRPGLPTGICHSQAERRASPLAPRSLACVSARRERRPGLADSPGGGKGSCPALPPAASVPGPGPGAAQPGQTGELLCGGFTA